MSEQNTPKLWRHAGAPAVLDEARQAHAARGPQPELLGDMLEQVLARASSGAPTPHYDAGTPAAPSVVARAGLGTKLGGALLLVTLAVVAWRFQAPSSVVSAPAPGIVNHASQPQIPAARADEAPTPPAAARADNAPAPLKRSTKKTRSPAPAQQLAQLDAAPSGSPLEELALLRRARRALASDPATVLRLTAEHEAAFAHGTFAEEREVLAIEALLASQRRAEAEQRAQHFRAAYPESLHVRRLNVVLQRGL